MPPRATACAECAKRGKKCRRFSYCLYLQAESATASVTPIAAGASAGASRSKRRRKEAEKFVPEGKVQADYDRRRRIRKLKDATFALNKKNR